MVMPMMMNRLLLLLLPFYNLTMLTVEASTKVASMDTSSLLHNMQELMPLSFEGIELPVHRELSDGKMLYRNGHGLRSFSMYGLSLKMYVASFYSETPLRDELEVLACSGCPLLFHFTFLRSVGQAKVRFAWQKQLEYSVSYKYDEYEHDRDAFLNMFGAMEHEGSVTVKFVGENTLVSDQGRLRGTILGENFQRAFLSMWFGDKAVQEDLKSALLGNNSSSQQTTIHV